MRIAVTGKSGQVVSALLEYGSADVVVIPVGRPLLDLAEPETILPALRKVRPDLVVSAAGYTQVDRAETEPGLAFAINAAGAGKVAEAARAIGVPIIHLSTDYVFGGGGHLPLIETDSVAPLNVYGASKLAGEAAVATATDNHVILRLAWIYSPFGGNFVASMLRLGAANDHVRVVADQWGRPTSAHDIAEGIVAIARNLLERPRAGDLRGLFHMPASGEANWAGFAEAIFAGQSGRGGKPVFVEQIATTDYPTPARRPSDSRLDGGLLADRHGVVLPCWEPSLERVLDRLIGQRLVVAGAMEALS